MSQHAALAPSSAPQWGVCAGSVKAQAGLPNPDSSQSREGTAAHWVFAEVAENLRTPGRGGPVLCSQFIGATAPNGVIVDGKMAEGAQIIVDDIMAVCEQYGGTQQLLVERRVFMPEIHAENWGTLDAALFLPAHGLLFIWDYKHGHRECPAKDNKQVIDYIAGLVELYQIDGIRDRQITVCARIVQPFCYHAAGPIDEWVVRLQDLRGEFNNLQNKAHEALGPDPTLTAGKHCRDCRAVGKCAAARRVAYTLIDAVRAPYEMDEMQGPDLAVERGILEEGLAVVKARLAAIEDELHHRVTNGDATTGLAVETSAGNLAWTIPDAQAVALAAQFGIDAAKSGVLTPTQTKAAAPKETRSMFEQVLKSVTRRPAGKLKLVKAENSIVARAFKNRG